MLVNLTAHTINEVTTGASIPPSGRVARVKASTRKVNEFLGYPIFESTFGPVEGLPEEQEGVMYIVSALCMNACPERYDLLSPGNVMRSEEGKIIGCIGFRAK
jgi:hypothetical protein